MRISDWSSDVCSSDLDQIVEAAIAEQHPVAGVVHHDRQALNARSDDEAGQQIDGDSVNMDGDGARPDCYRPLEDEQQGVATVVDDRQFADQRQGAAPRSEEPTSELQSLMRLSYAVFCLKKKNTEHIYKTIQQNP